MQLIFLTVELLVNNKHQVVNVKIALIADEGTVNYFKLAGLNRTFIVADSIEAEKRIREFIDLKEFAIIIITDDISRSLQSLVDEITENYEFPIIISIPSIDRTSQPIPDQITELIKRKTGIELKV